MPKSEIQKEKVSAEKSKKTPSEKSKFRYYKPRSSKSKEVKNKTSMSAPKKLQLLFTIVNREKTEFYIDLLQEFEINMQMILNAQGTANDHILSLLGLNDSDKSVIISAVRREKAKEALAVLEEKFKTVRGGKGIAYTVPVSSTIGVAIYQFLSNTVGGGLI